MQIDTWQIDGNNFHFGRHGLGQEETGVYFPSDTLFAALIARLALLRGAPAVEPWVSRFHGESPPLVFSSAYPRAGGVRFYPTPQIAPSGASLDAGLGKKLKKVKYVSEALFLGLLGGKALPDLIPGSRWLQKGQVLVSAAEVAQLPEALRAKTDALWQMDRRARVTIDRNFAQSALFFTGQMVYSSGCGLWFGARWLEQDPTLASDLQTLLDDLGDAGLGGERSTGFGKASITPSGSVELPDPQGRTWVTLSRYLPRPDEMPALLSERAAYHLESVGGWINSPGHSSERRRAVRMLLEGSVLGPLPRAVPGQIVDVRPTYAANPDPLGHAVWRCGQALAVGLE